jgi:hypothetical protein
VQLFAAIHVRDNSLICTRRVEAVAILLPCRVLDARHISRPPFVGCPGHFVLYRCLDSIMPWQRAMAAVRTPPRRVTSLILGSSKGTDRAVAKALSFEIGRIGCAQLGHPASLAPELLVRSALIMKRGVPNGSSFHRSGPRQRQAV